MYVLKLSIIILSFKMIFQTTQLSTFKFMLCVYGVYSNRAFVSEEEEEKVKYDELIHS